MSKSNFLHAVFLFCVIHGTFVAMDVLFNISGDVIVRSTDRTHAFQAGRLVLLVLGATSAMYAIYREKRQQPAAEDHAD